MVTETMKRCAACDSSTVYYGFCSHDTINGIPFTAINMAPLVRLSTLTSPDILGIWYHFPPLTPVTPRTVNMPSNPPVSMARQS